MPKKRAVDELPQSGKGKTIMTTEPKFIPQDAVTISLDDGSAVKVRLVDCVGFTVGDAVGYLEEDGERMVKTPWFNEDIPFEEAAVVGTKKSDRGAFNSGCACNHRRQHWRYKKTKL